MDDQRDYAEEAENARLLRDPDPDPLAGAWVELLDMRDRISAIAEAASQASYDYRATVDTVRGAARTAEALSAASEAIFNAVSTASSFWEDPAARRAIGDRLGRVFGGGGSDGS